MQAGERLGAVAPGGDDLGDHRVVLGRDDVALGDTGVDPDARPDRQRQHLDRARRRRERPLRVLGVEPGLDRVALRRRRLTLQAPAGRHVQLQLDEIEAGRQLGHRVLDLQAGVDLQEREALLGRLVQELDRAGVLVAGDGGQAHRRGAQVAVLLRREQRALRLLDHLLVAPLHAAVAHADGPGRAVPVGDHLDLDVAGTRDDALHEHGGVAERLEALRAGALERLGEPGVVVDATDAAPAAAGRGLDHQRVADLRGVAPGVLQRVDRPAAPRRHRHGGLLGQPLGADLVAEPAHHLGTRTDERDAEADAQLGELRALGDEAPADPRRVGPRRDERPLQRVEVEVRAVEQHRLVGLAHEHRRALGRGVQGDGADVLVAFDAQLAHRVDETHRGLTAVDHCDPTEPPTHHGRMVCPIRGPIDQRGVRTTCCTTARRCRRAACRPVRPPRRRARRATRPAREPRPRRRRATPRRAP